MAQRQRLVLFDMDEVLCGYDRGARIAALAALSGTAPDAIEAAIWGSGFEALGDSGQLSAEAYLRGFGERIGHPLTLAEWVATRRAGMTARPDMLALVGRLRAGGVRVAVFTNNPPPLLGAIDTLYPGLREAFGGDILVSGMLGLAKPAPEAFRRCLARLGAAPAEAFFTDDLEENVAGARAAGLAAHRFRDRAGLEAALARAGVT